MVAKKPGDVQGLVRANRAAARLLRELLKRAKPGVKTEELDARDKRLKSRIERARQDRNHVQTSINKFYELALPWRQPVSTNPTDALHPRPLEKQSDIFDDMMIIDR